jgi:hypothetical protein
MWFEILQILVGVFLASFVYLFLSSIVEMKQRNLTGLSAVPSCVSFAGPLYIPYLGYVIRILVRNFVYKNDNMAMMSAQFNQHNTIFVRYLLQHQRD